MKKNNFYIRFFMIALPIMAQAILTTTVNLVDNIMVGQLGNNVISAVSASNRYLMMFNYMLWGVMGASGIFIAQYYGSKKTEEMKQSFRFSILSALCLAVIAIFSIQLFHRQIGLFFVKDEDVLHVISTYLLIMSIGYIPFTFSQSIASAMRSIGEIRLPVITTICGVVVNVILNYLLIFGNFYFPKLGVSGAAIATVIARCSEFCILYYFYKKNHYDFTTKIKNVFHIELFRAKMILKKAMPLMLNEFAFGAGLAMILKLYGTRGINALTAHGIASASTDMFYASFQGIMTATTILIGHELGANHLEVAKQNSKKLLKATFCIGIFCSLILFVLSPIFPRIYNFSNTITSDALALSLNMIWIYGTFLWSHFVIIAGYMILRVGGDMRSTLILDGIFMWVVNIGVVAIFTYFTTFNVLVLMTIGFSTDIIKLLLSLYLVKKEKWLVNLAAH